MSDEWCSAHSDPFSFMEKSFLNEKNGKLNERETWNVNRIFTDVIVDDGSMFVILWHLELLLANDTHELWE